ncbi:MAG: hypothetical protein EOL87_01830 [Spartobacteria bacterium]|nr:hypothetical protein [Spartobacteria bacterium]
MSVNVRDPILTMRDVVILSPVPSTPNIGPISLELFSGQGLLVHIPNHLRLLALPDVMHGMVPPLHGSVLYKNIAWEDRKPDERSRAYASIGRVFHGHSWISNLDVDENVRLKMYHHTKVAEKEIMREAQELASYFDLKTIPPIRPDFADPHALQRCQWIRALMGKPELLLLVYPEIDAQPAYIDTLMGMVQTRIEQGASIVWFTMSNKFWQHTDIKNMNKACIDDGKWTVYGSNDEQ